MLAENKEFTQTEIGKEYGEEERRMSLKSGFNGRTGLLILPKIVIDTYTASESNTN